MFKHRQDNLPTCRTLADLNRVVALGGGHGLGRVLSSLSALGNRLTGIVTTTDDGGSTGRIRRAQGGIAWGDTRNCLNQLITEPSTASAMFEYRFTGNGELSGHNLGNLMLKALEDLSVRPLEAINLIRELLNVEAQIIPMSELPTDLNAIDHDGNLVFGEVNIDRLAYMPDQLILSPQVPATPEAILALREADVILIGPGSFLTSLMPLLLVNDIAQAIQHSLAKIIYIDSLGREISTAASNATLEKKLETMQQALYERAFDAVIVGNTTDLTPLQASSQFRQTLFMQTALAAQDIAYRHDREYLHQAIAFTLHQLTRSYHK